MNYKALGFFCIPLMLIAAAWAGYTLYSPGSHSSAPKMGGTLSVSTQPQEIAPEGTRDANNESAQNPSVFSYMGWAADEDSAQPKACFEFSNDVQSSNTVALKDYVRVTPETPVSVTVAGPVLCLGGFDFDKDYEVTFLKGLPSSDAQKTLLRDRFVPIGFGDKPAYVAFAGDGIILPRINAQGLAIETINVDKLTVEVARVSERMIARSDPQSGTATLEGDYSWEYNDAAKSIRSILWSGEIDVKSIRNQKVTTVLPLSDLTGSLEPGAYVVTAERLHGEDENNVARAWRWIISTDIALSSFEGQDGMTLIARSIDTAKIMSGLTLKLVAENNDILESRTTDSQGIAKFSAPLLKGEGPKQPKMIMAFGKEGDYAVLDLSRAPLDLSEFDVTGRKVAKATDLFGYFERGVYRPGETAHLTVLFRDAEGKIKPTQPLTLSVKRPNGLEVYKERIAPAELDANGGALIWAYIVPKSAQRGMWSVDISEDGLGNIGRTRFSVEDFVPAKLRLSIEADLSPMTAKGRRDITLDSQFLYGAPGAGLEGEAEARIRIDPKPFAGFETYSFGPAETNFEEQFVTLETGVTDGAGKLPLSFDLKDQNLSSSHPLRAEITVGVAEPGGRYVRDSVRIPVRSEGVYPGLKAQFQSARAPRNKPAEFEVVALDRTGTPVSRSLTWTLYSEDWDYQWYREGERWRYRRDVRETPIQTGDLSVQSGAPALWSKTLDWGNYRLEVKTEDGTLTSSQFGVGWGEASLSDRPDSLQMAGPSRALQPGEPIILSINAPYSGKATLVIADETIRSVLTLDIAEGGSEITLPFDARWGQSVYALLSTYTPRDAVGRPVPRRAVGLAYIERDRASQKLAVTIETKDRIRPRSPQKFKVKVDNIPRGQDAWISFAAVDEGILQLTKYRSPDAAQYYFGKKAFNVTARDDYARILNPNLGAPAIANSGGDSLGGEGLTVVPTRTVALFEGPVKIKRGTAEVSLDIPDFNGELRIMVTAWSPSAVGSASRPVTVRDKVPAIVGLPRFLAPGDQAMATVSLDNVEGKAGLYEATLVAGTHVTGGGVLALDLAPGNRREDRLDIRADSLGTDELTLNVTGPENYSVQTTYPLEVRSAFRPLTTRQMTALSPGESLRLGPDSIENFSPIGTDISLTFSRTAGVNAGPYIQSLARYPYGCTEQTVSTAMPLLYASELGGFTDQSALKTRQNIRDSIDRLVSRQSSDGAFGLWREGDGLARPWLGVYVSDFLRRAEAQGYAVPESVTAASLKAMRKISQMPDYPNVGYDFSYGLRYGDNKRAEQMKAEAAAFAHYVLVKSGKGDLSGLRYLFDNHSAAIQTPLAHAYLGAALDAMGDSRRANKAFEQGQARSGLSLDYDYYQSSLRDAAGFVMAVVDAGRMDQSAKIIETFTQSLKDPERLNTQEKAYVVLAIEALGRGVAKPKISAENVEATAALDPKNWGQGARLNGTDLTAAPVFTNTGDSRIWADVSVSGVPLTAPLARSDGFTVSKSVYRTSGRLYGGEDVKQGESLVVKLAFESKFEKDRAVVLADLLPAGFEIEAVLTPEDGARKDGIKGAYAYVGDISEFNIAEARDDRFVASVNSDGKETYIAAYLIRAVTSGDYVFPGVVVEDMYRPAELALTEASRVRITDRPNL